MAEADEKRDGSDDAEGAIDESPEERNPAEGAGDEGQSKNRGAGDHSELQDPLIANRIEEGADEGNGEDEVGEGKPVCSVGQEWGVDAVVIEGLMDALDPHDDGLRQEWVCVEQSDEEFGFAYQREGSDAAEYQSDDKRREPDADGAKVLGGRHCEDFLKELMARLPLAERFWAAIVGGSLPQSYPCGFARKSLQDEMVAFPA